MLLPIIFLFSTLLFLLLVFVRVIVICKYRKKISNAIPDDKYPTALVLGAGLRKDGTATSILSDRVTCGVRLFQNQSASHLIFSGAGSGGKNETLAMNNLALQLGMDNHFLTIDPHGERTIISILRAKEIHKVQKILIVSQRFHLYRALLLADAIGIDALGVPADLHKYRLFSQLWWSLREIPATAFALFEIAWHKCPRRHIAQ